MQTVAFKIPKLQMTELGGQTKKQSFSRRELQMIAVWGSPGSGKTTLAIQIAQELAKEKKNVVLVHDDIFCPTLPVLFPTLEKEQQQKSLGKVLTSPLIDQDLIRDHLVTMKHSNYIAFLGYQKGENPHTYAEYTKEKPTDLLILLRHLADYIVVDCSSIITESLLSATALTMADQVIRLSTADFKGLSYFKSTLPLMMDQTFQTENHLRVVSNVKDYQADQAVNTVLRGASIFLPHTPEIERKHTEGDLFGRLSEKKSRRYNKELGKIMKEVFRE